MKRLLIIPVGVVLGILSWCMLMYSQSSPRVDYVATMRTVAYNTETGAEIQTVDTVFAQAGDGTSIRQVHGRTETVDPKTRQVTLSDQLTKEYMTQPLSAQSVSNRLSPVPDSCEAAFKLPCTNGPDILGHKTKVIMLSSGACDSSKPNCKVSETLVYVAKDLNWARVGQETRVDGKLAQKDTALSITWASSGAYRDDLRGYRHVTDIGEFTEHGTAARGLPAVTKEKLDEIRKRQVDKENNIRSTYSLIGQARIWFYKNLAAL